MPLTNRIPKHFGRFCFVNGFQNREKKFPQLRNHIPKFTDRSKYSLELKQIECANSEQIQVSGDAVILTLPYKKKTGSFQDELIGIRRNTQPVKKALHCITDEKKVDIFAIRACFVQQLLKYGV